MLETVRRYTGNRFSAAKGYDLRKPMSRKRVLTIERYFEMVQEMTTRPHQLVKPKKGEKREAFAFTGQSAFPRFEYAFLPIVDPASKFTYEIDKSRPRGSQFVVIDKCTKERMTHIPADLFVSEYYTASDGENLWDEEEVDPSFFADVIEEYAERSGVMMIEAGEFHMWGTAGGPERVSEKLSELFRSYGASNFDPFNKNSHYIGNWFRGVQVFTNDVGGRYYEDRLNNRIEYLATKYGAEAHNMVGRKIRRLKSGDIGEFVNGELKHVIKSTDIKGAADSTFFRKKRVVKKYKPGRVIK